MDFYWQMAQKFQTHITVAHRLKWVEMQMTVSASDVAVVATELDIFDLV